MRPPCPSRLPPRVARQRVGQRLTLDQRQRGAEEGDGRGGVGLRLRLGGERDGTLHVDGDLGRELVQTVTGPGGKERIAVLVDPHGAAGRVRGVEQRLRRSVGVGRAQDTRAEPIARNDVGLVQGQIGDELDGPAGAIGRKVVAAARRAAASW